MGQLDSKLLMESWSLRHLSHEHPRPFPTHTNAMLWADACEVLASKAIQILRDSGSFYIFGTLNHQCPLFRLQQAAGADVALPRRSD